MKDKLALAETKSEKISFKASIWLCLKKMKLWTNMKVMTKCICKDGLGHAAVTNNSKISQWRNTKKCFILIHATCPTQDSRGVLLVVVTQEPTATWYEFPWLFDMRKRKWWIIHWLLRIVTYRVILTSDSPVAYKSGAYFFLHTFLVFSCSIEIQLTYKITFLFFSQIQCPIMSWKSFEASRIVWSNRKPSYWRRYCHPIYQTMKDLWQNNFLNLVIPIGMSKYAYFGKRLPGHIVSDV